MLTRDLLWAAHPPVGLLLLAQDPYGFSHAWTRVGKRGNRGFFSGSGRLLRRNGRLIGRCSVGRHVLPLPGALRRRPSSEVFPGPPGYHLDYDAATERARGLVHLPF